MDETVKSEVEALRKDFKQVKDDLAGLTKALKELGTKRAAEGAEDLKVARDKVEAQLRHAAHEARGTLNEARGTLEDQIREKPLGTLAIAFAVGLLLGKTLRG
jgi:ElaB/YqjD/DUF883 family membrane-anchored ribosome-binding protein